MIAALPRRQTARSFNAGSHYSVKQKALFVVAAIFITVSIVVVVLRFWAKRLQKVPWLASDYIAAIALSCVLVQSVCGIMAVVYGVGASEDRAPIRYNSAVTAVLAQTTILWIFGKCFSRLTLLQMYCETFQLRHFKVACWTNMCLNAACCIAQTTTYFAVCQPIAARWDPSLRQPKDRCKSLRAGAIVTGVLSVVLDLAVILLPQRLVWRLNMPLRNKVIVSMMFGLGIIVIGSGIARICLVAAQYRDKPEVNGSSNAYLVGLAAYIDTTLALVIVCLPVLGPVLSKIQARTRGALSSQAHHEDASHGSRASTSRPCSHVSSNGVSPSTPHLPTGSIPASGNEQASTARNSLHTVPGQKRVSLTSRTSCPRG